MYERTYSFFLLTFNRKESSRLLPSLIQEMVLQGLSTCYNTVPIPPHFLNKSSINVFQWTLLSLHLGNLLKIYVVMTFSPSFFSYSKRKIVHLQTKIVHLQVVILFISETLLPRTVLSYHGFNNVLTYYALHCKLTYVQFLSTMPPLEDMQSRINNPQMALRYFHNCQLQMELLFNE